MRAGRPEPCGPVPGQGAPPRGLVLPVLHGREQGRLRNPMMRGWGSHLLLGPPVGPASMGGGAEKSQEGVDSNGGREGTGAARGPLSLPCLSASHLPVPVSLCLSLCVSVSVSLYLCISVSQFLSQCLCLPVFPCMPDSLCLSLCVFLSLSHCLSVSVCLSVSLCHCLSFSVSLSLSFSVPLSLSPFLSVSLLLVGWKLIFREQTESEES